jgi:hypothetical protein
MVFTNVQTKSPELRATPTAIASPLKFAIIQPAFAPVWALPELHAQTTMIACQTFAAAVIARLQSWEKRAIRTAIAAQIWSAIPVRIFV